jgi:hypothetical protein
MVSQAMEAGGGTGTPSRPHSERGNVVGVRGRRLIRERAEPEGGQLHGLHWWAAELAAGSTLCSPLSSLAVLAVWASATFSSQALAPRRAHRRGRGQRANRRAAPPCWRPTPRWRMQVLLHAITSARIWRLVLLFAPVILLAKLEHLTVLAGVLRRMKLWLAAGRYSCRGSPACSVHALLSVLELAAGAGNHHGGPAHVRCHGPAEQRRGAPQQLRHRGGAPATVQRVRGGDGAGVRPGGRRGRRRMSSSRAQRPAPRVRAGPHRDERRRN